MKSIVDYITNTFNYIIENGHYSNDLDLVLNNFIDLNGGSLKDNSGNNANIELSIYGGEHSLSHNKDITIDALSPIVYNVNASPSEGVFGIGAIIEIEINFSGKYY